MRRLGRWDAETNIWNKAIGILLSMGVLTILSILLIMAVLVRVKLGYLVLFSQERFSKDEKTLGYTNSAL